LIALNRVHGTQGVCTNPYEGASAIIQNLLEIAWTAIDTEGKEDITSVAGAEDCWQRLSPIYLPQLLC
jgi:hypothetical protein